MAAPAHALDLLLQAPILPGAGSNAGAAAISGKLNTRVHRTIATTFDGYVAGAGDSAEIDHCLAAIREQAPQARFIRFRDNRTGHEWLAIIEPGNNWHELLPDEQTVLIHTREDLPRAD